MTSFNKRLITSFFLIVFLSLMFFTNKLILFIGVLFISSLSLYEMSEVLKKIKIRINLLLAEIANFFIMFSAYFGKIDFIILTLTITSLIALAMATFIKAIKLENQFPLIFILAYISLTFSYLLRMPNTFYMLLVFFISWGTDTCAYLSGMFLGKRKLIEWLSPKKTIEGSIGGMVGAMVLTLILGLIFSVENKLALVLLAALVSIVSQIGDLCASYIKRLTNTKDYGYILIGHGGMLDRFDSVLFVIPIVYYISQVI